MRKWSQMERGTNGVDMVVIDGVQAAGWAGMGEEQIRKRLQEKVASEKEEDQSHEGISVLGVFTIP